MHVSRHFTLPLDSYYGDVWTAEQTVHVSYNEEMEEYVEGVGDDELKMALEDVSAKAALEGGYHRVKIRSTIHPSTRSPEGHKIGDNMHITISASGPYGHATGHVYCTGLGYKRLPPHWYEDVDFDFVRWDYDEPDDASDSVRISTPKLENNFTFDPNGLAQPCPPSPPMRQWVLMPPLRRAPGMEYQWWDGAQFVEKYTSEYGKRRPPTPDRDEAESDDERLEIDGDSDSGDEEMSLGRCSEEGSSSPESEENGESEEDEDVSDGEDELSAEEDAQSDDEGEEY